MLATFARTTTLFLLAGLCEIGGGYLIWQCLRERKSPVVGLLGAVLLVLYGVIPVLQPSMNFGRLYAAYGGVFVVLSLLWGWRFDGRVPDKPDCWGALLCLIGVAVILYGPRAKETNHDSRNTSGTAISAGLPPDGTGTAGAPVRGAGDSGESHP